jgi:hypothetical protein
MHSRGQPGFGLQRANAIVRRRSGGSVEARFREGVQQLDFLVYEVRFINKAHPPGWFTCYFRASFWVIARYGVSRFLYLTLGPVWKVLHTLLLPVFFLRETLDTGIRNQPPRFDRKGLRIAHPSLGAMLTTRRWQGASSQGSRANSQTDAASAARPKLP